VDNKDAQNARMWRIIGWVIAAVAVVVVAGPQVLALLSS